MSTCELGIGIGKAFWLVRLVSQLEVEGREGSKIVSLRHTTSSGYPSGELMVFQVSSNEASILTFSTPGAGGCHVPGSSCPGFLPSDFLFQVEKLSCDTVALNRVWCGLRVCFLKIKWLRSFHMHHKTVATSSKLGELLCPAKYLHNHSSNLVRPTRSIRACREGSFQICVVQGQSSKVRSIVSGSAYILGIMV